MTTHHSQIDIPIVLSCLFPGIYIWNRSEPDMATYFTGDFDTSFDKGAEVAAMYPVIIKK